MNGIEWSEDRVARLKALNDQKLSANEIAAAMGGITRNAVIGKLNRLGIGLATGGYNAVRMDLSPKERQARRMARQRDRRRSNPTPVYRRIKTNRIEIDSDLTALFDKNRVDQLTEEQKAKTVTFAQLSDKHCRWPYGDIETGIVFCGCDRAPDKPYCAPHNALAYQPLRPKSDTFKPLGEIVNSVVDNIKRTA